MTYILSQIFGGLVFVAVFLALQMSDMKRSLLCQIACNVLGMLSYVLAGGISGCGIYLVASAALGILRFHILKKEKAGDR